MTEVEKALEVLSGAVKTARGRSALSTLESELQVGGKSVDKKDPGAPAFPDRNDVVARMRGGAGSARGGATA